MNNTNERTELIAGIKHELVEFAHNKTLETLLLDAIEMLKADAHELTRLRQIAREASDAATQLQKQVLILKPQQVVPLSDAQIEYLREKTFSTGNPYCPVDSKSMRKAARAIEAHHGIGAKS